MYQANTMEQRNTPLYGKCTSIIGKLFYYHCKTGKLIGSFNLKEPTSIGNCKTADIYVNAGSSGIKCVIARNQQNKVVLVNQSIENATKVNGISVPYSTYLKPYDKIDVSGRAFVFVNDISTPIKEVAKRTTSNRTPATPKNVHVLTPKVRSAIPQRVRLFSCAKPFLTPNNCRHQPKIRSAIKSSCEKAIQTDTVLLVDQSIRMIDNRKSFLRRKGAATENSTPVVSCCNCKRLPSIDDKSCEYTPVKSQQGLTLAAAYSLKKCQNSSKQLEVPKSFSNVQEADTNADTTKRMRSLSSRKNDIHSRFLTYNSPVLGYNNSGTVVNSSQRNKLLKQMKTSLNNSKNAVHRCRISTNASHNDTDELMSTQGFIEAEKLVASSNSSLVSKSMDCVEKATISDFNEFITYDYVSDTSSNQTSAEGDFSHGNSSVNSCITHVSEHKYKDASDTSTNQNMGNADSCLLGNTNLDDKNDQLFSNSSSYPLSKQRPSISMACQTYNTIPEHQEINIDIENKMEDLLSVRSVGESERSVLVLRRHEARLSTSNFTSTIAEHNDPETDKNNDLDAINIHDGVGKISFSQTLPDLQQSCTSCTNFMKQIYQNDSEGLRGCHEKDTHRNSLQLNALSNSKHIMNELNSILEEDESSGDVDVQNNSSSVTPLSRSISPETSSDTAQMDSCRLLCCLEEQNVACVVSSSSKSNTTQIQKDEIIFTDVEAPEFTNMENLDCNSKRLESIITSNEALHLFATSVQCNTEENIKKSEHEKDFLSVSTKLRSNTLNGIINSSKDVGASKQEHEKLANDGELKSVERILSSTDSTATIPVIIVPENTVAHTNNISMNSSISKERDDLINLHNSIIANSTESGDSIHPSIVNDSTKDFLNGDLKQNQCCVSSNSDVTILSTEESFACQTDNSNNDVKHLLVLQSKTNNYQQFESDINDSVSAKSPQSFSDKNYLLASTVSSITCIAPSNPSITSNKDNNLEISLPISALSLSASVSSPASVSPGNTALSVAKTISTRNNINPSHTPISRVHSECHHLNATNDLKQLFVVSGVNEKDQNSSNVVTKENVASKVNTREKLSVNVDKDHSRNAPEILGRNMDKGSPTFTRCDKGEDLPIIIPTKQECWIANNSDVTIVSSEESYERSTNNCDNLKQQLITESNINRNSEAIKNNENCIDLFTPSDMNSSVDHLRIASKKSKLLKLYRTSVVERNLDTIASINEDEHTIVLCLTSENDSSREARNSKETNITCNEKLDLVNLKPLFSTPQSIESDKEPNNYSLMNEECDAVEIGKMDLLSCHEKSIEERFANTEHHNTNSSLITTPVKLTHDCMPEDCDDTPAYIGKHCQSRLDVGHNMAQDLVPRQDSDSYNSSTDETFVEIDLTPAPSTMIPSEVNNTSELREQLTPLKQTSLLCIDNESTANKRSGVGQLDIRSSLQCNATPESVKSCKKLSVMATFTKQIDFEDKSDKVTLHTSTATEGISPIKSLNPNGSLAKLCVSESATNCNPTSAIESFNGNKNASVVCTLAEKHTDTGCKISSDTAKADNSQDKRSFDLFVSKTSLSSIDNSKIDNSLCSTYSSSFEFVNLTKTSNSPSDNASHEPQTSSIIDNKALCETIERKEANQSHLSEVGLDLNTLFHTSLASEEIKSLSLTQNSELLIESNAKIEFQNPDMKYADLNCPEYRKFSSPSSGVQATKGRCAAATVASECSSKILRKIPIAETEISNDLISNFDTANNCNAHNNKYFNNTETFNTPKRDKSYETLKNDEYLNASVHAEFHSTKSCEKETTDATMVTSTESVIMITESSPDITTISNKLSSHYVIANNEVSNDERRVGSGLKKSTKVNPEENPDVTDALLKLHVTPIHQTENLDSSDNTAAEIRSRQSQPNSPCFGVSCISSTPAVKTAPLVNYEKVTSLKRLTEFHQTECSLAPVISSSVVDKASAPITNEFITAAVDDSQKVNITLSNKRVTRRQAALLARRSRRFTFKGDVDSHVKPRKSYCAKSEMIDSHSDVCEKEKDPPKRGRQKRTLKTKKADEDATEVIKVASQINIPQELNDQQPCADDIQSTNTKRVTRRQAILSRRSRRFSFKVETNALRWSVSNAKLRRQPTILLDEVDVVMEEEEKGEEKVEIKKPAKRGRPRRMPKVVAPPHQRITDDKTELPAKSECTTPPRQNKVQHDIIDSNKDGNNSATAHSAVPPSRSRRQLKKDTHLKEATTPSSENKENVINEALKTRKGRGAAKNSTLHKVSQPIVQNISPIRTRQRRGAIEEATEIVEEVAPTKRSGRTRRARVVK